MSKVKRELRHSEQGVAIACMVFHGTVDGVGVLGEKCRVRGQTRPKKTSLKLSLRALRV